MAIRASSTCICYMNDQMAGQTLTEEGQDRLFSCLAHPTRRAVFQLLGNQDGEIHLADLVRDLAAEGGDEAITDGGKGALGQKHLYTALYHNHIPKLADADLVSFDQELKTIRVTVESPRWKEAQALLTKLE